MSHLIGHALLVFTLLFAAQIEAAEQASAKPESDLALASKSAYSQAFNSAIYQQLKQHYQGREWVTLLWSVDCPPCMKELAIVQTLQQQQDELAIVIINVDTHEDSEQQRNEVVAHFELSSQTHLHFRDGFENHSRYLIDPQWFGELPRTYFIDKSGTFYGKSGLASRELLESVLLL